MKNFKDILLILIFYGFIIIITKIGCMIYEFNFSKKGEHIMSIINGVHMPNFTHEEIPPEKAKYMEKFFLLRVQEYRNVLGCPFSISKATGALVRFDGRKTSQHYVIPAPELKGHAKLSRACDGFPGCDIFEAWTKALSSKLFGGVGVYFDTKNNQGRPQPMLHLDMRPKPLIWYRNNSEYFYPGKDKDFFDNLTVLLTYC